MTDDADLDLVRRTFAAFARGDLAELTQCFAPDVEQFVPGKHALAGVFRGVDNVVACLGDTAAAADGTMTVTLEDVLSNTDGQVIAVYRLRPAGPGRSSTSARRSWLPSPVVGSPDLASFTPTRRRPKASGHDGGLAFTSHRLAADLGLHGPHADDHLRGFRGNQLSGPHRARGMHPRYGVLTSNAVNPC